MTAAAIAQELKSVDAAQVTYATQFASRLLADWRDIACPRQRLTLDLVKLFEQSLVTQVKGPSRASVLGIARITIVEAPTGRAAGNGSLQVGDIVVHARGKAICPAKGFLVVDGDHSAERPHCCQILLRPVLSLCGRVSLTRPMGSKKIDIHDLHVLAQLVLGDVAGMGRRYQQIGIELLSQRAKIGQVIK